MTDSEEEYVCEHPDFPRWEKRRGKKGQVVMELILIIVLMLVMGIVWVYGNQIFSEINTDIQADDSISQVAKNQSESTVTQFPRWADNIAVFLLVSFWVLMLVGSFLIDSHPVFFIITFVLLIFAFVLATMVANVYEEVTSEDGIDVFALDFPKLNWVMQHLLTIVIVMGLSVALVMFAKETR